MEMNRQWTDTFRTEIERFQETINAFDKGEIDRKSYKGVSGGLGSYAQRDPAKHMLRLRLLQFIRYGKVSNALYHRMRAIRHPVENQRQLFIGRVARKNTAE